MNEIWWDASCPALCPNSGRGDGDAAKAQKKKKNQVGIALMRLSSTRCGLAVQRSELT